MPKPDMDNRGRNSAQRPAKIISREQPARRIP
jgi:hypothetical protein